ncbi:MAG: hypothetical protein JXB38_01930 [Anaerolineales bacterium]|nr:hypothetical protein [Anaerolineales bacterium]
MKTKTYPFLAIIFTLMLASLACTLGESAPTETATPTPLDVAAGDATLVPNPTPASDDSTEPVVDDGAAPTATEEVAPTATADSSSSGGSETVCTPDGAYVADVTVPDNTVFDPNTNFTKTWKLQNDGDCTWPSGTLLTFVSGDPMSAPASVPAPQLAAGAQTNISVEFKSPASPGTYKSNWQLQAPDGTRFGPTVYVQIIVPENKPDLVVQHLTFSDTSPEQDVAFNVIATLHNSGDGPANDATWHFKPCESCSWVEASGSYDLDAGETVEATTSFTYTACGAMTTSAKVDRGNAIAETNDSNNTRDFNVVVGCPAPVSQSLAPYQKVTFSVGGQSNDIRLGIAGNGDALRTAYAFNLSSLAGLDSDSTITSATLDVSNFSGGSCFEFLHPLKVQRIDFAGNSPQYPADFNSAALEILKSAADGTNIGSPVNITSSMQNFVAANGAAPYQVRMELEHDDAGSAFACMMQWSSVTLNITYTP